MVQLVIYRFQLVINSIRLVIYLFQLVLNSFQLVLKDEDTIVPTQKNWKIAIYGGTSAQLVKKSIQPLKKLPQPVIKLLQP